MKERPIIFTSESVLAILGGTKTQTRRNVKSRHDWDMDEKEDGSPWPFFRPYVYDDDQPVMVPCPHGRPGERLWVRETWGMSYVDRAISRPFIQRGTWGSPARPDRKPCVIFRADGEMPDESPMETATWSSPIHMPRWASRLTLEIVSVRVERLQSISMSDIRAEGMDFLPGTSHREALGCFADAWYDLHGKGAWKLNPWVWRIEFARAES